MPANILIVFGATGQQGSSVIEHVLKDPELSQKYKIRGLTRDPSKPDGQALAKKGVEAVKCDISNRDSLKTALKDAHTVFAMTATDYAPGGIDRELEQGKAIADEAVAAGVSFLVYSAVPSTKKISGGKYPVNSFVVKDDVRVYIESLPIKSAFFLPGSFMANFHTNQAPRPDNHGELAIWGFVDSRSKLALFDTAGDTGKYVAAILAEPDKFTGKAICAATRTYTMDEIATIMSKASGKDISYKQVPKDTFGSFLPEAMRGTVLNMLSYFEEFGYYGPETEQLVAEGAKNARSKPTELEEYLKREPLNV